jgi:O-succinylbenzoic acid--CoA ligase
VSALPGLADAVAVSAPSAEWGEVPVVFSAGASTDGNATRLDEVRSAVQAALGPAARPAALLKPDGIPLLASGKPDRVALARRAAEWAAE